MAKKSDKKTKKLSKSKIKSNSIFLAFIVTFLSILGFLIVAIVGRNDKYAMHYAKQSLVIFIFAVIASITQLVLAFVPILGVIIEFTLTILVFIIWVVSWIFALTGKEKRIPIISDYSEKIML